MRPDGPGLRRPDLAVYLPVAAVTTVAAATGRERLHLVSKLLLAPTLAAGVVATREARRADRSATLVVALTGSGLGDWFMNRSGRAGTSDERRRLMRRGASAFAVQQAGFIRLLLADGARPGRAAATGVGAVLAGLAWLDSSGDDGLDPVLTGYGLLLAAMASLALSEAAGPRRRPGLALGGGLFLLSDAAIIAGEHLVRSPRQQAVLSGIVMSTYSAALGLLVHALRDDPGPTAPTRRA